MVENEGVSLRAIRWSEIFPWLSLASAFRLAASLRLMVIGSVAILLTLFGWWTIARVFSHNGALNRSWAEAFGQHTAWEVIDDSVPNQPLTCPLVGVSAITLSPGTNSGLNINAGGPLIRSWAVLNQPMWQVLSIQPSNSGEALTFGDFLALILSAGWSLAVWSFFGAAISRIAAVQLATGEQVGWGASLRWAGTKWLTYFSAPVLPILGVVLAVIPLLMLGLLMKYDFFAFLGGLIWLLVLIGAFVMAVLLVGVLLGWPLMWATISVEGTDSFDALNRTYSYVFQRPLRYLFYVVIASLLGWLGWILVENFAAFVISLASWAVSWGAGWDRVQELANGNDNSSLARGASVLIGFWSSLVKLLAIGYSFGYLGVASTAIYYLLRRDVDARETDEVYLDADQSEQKFGLPPLQKDAAGAPEIAEKASAVASTADGQNGVE
jgi:hypothetical protein